MTETTHKSNGLSKILSVLIPTLIVAITIWGITMTTKVDTLQSDFMTVKKDNDKRTDTIINMQIEQAKITTKLENIEKLLVEIKNEIRKK